MRRFKDVEHRLRLAAVFAAGLLVSGIARAELVPTGFGTLVPLGILAAVQLVRFSPRARVNLYLTAGVLALVGIFAMRWNVVIGGQLFSKSFLGYTTYKLGFATREGLLPAIMLMLLPFGILAVLLRVLPPWEQAAARAPLSERVRA
jgi:predicted membrane protein